MGSGLHGLPGSSDDESASAQTWNLPIDSIATSDFPAGHRLSRRWRLVAVVGLTAVLGGVGASVAAATGAFTPAAPPGLIPKQLSPPPQQITTGPPLSRAVILRTINLAGVTRYAIKTMPYKTIEDALHSVGLGFNRNVDPNWTPVPLADPVDVVVVAGNISPPGSHGFFSWEVEIINPVTGVLIGNSASSNGPWPSFFDSLPDQGQ
jgi:hypothetical protein